MKYFSHARHDSELNRLMQTPMGLLSRIQIFTCLSYILCIIVLEWEHVVFSFCVHVQWLYKETTLMSSEWLFCTFQIKVGSSGLLPVLTPCRLTFVTFLPFPILS